MFPKDLGKVSAKYESGGRGVDFVSNGRQWKDPGGDSYGVHQLSGTYSMGAFLRSEWGKPYKKLFAGYKPNTDAFNRKYKQVAREQPEEFAEAQKNFYASTHYVPLRDYAEQLGFDVNNRGVQEALFSMSVQHGRAKYIVKEVADAGIPEDPEDQIRDLFEQRGEYVNSLRTLTRQIKRNIVEKRYKQEVEDCVALVDQQQEDSTAEVSNKITDAIETIRNALNFIPSVAAEIVEELQSLVENLQLNTEVTIESRTTSIPWLETAKSEIGLKEIVGSRHNTEILSWAKEGLPKWISDFYTNDEIPWCGLYIAHLMVENDIPVDINNPLSAREWNKFGHKVEPQLGCIMVFSREGGGHVGLYVSEDDKYYHILGGNQSNSVNVTKVAKNRFLGARWPNGYEKLQEQHIGRIEKKFDGKVSTNEQ